MLEDRELGKPKEMVIKFPDGIAPNESTQILKALWDRMTEESGIDRILWPRYVDKYILDSKKAKGITNVNMVEERSSINKKFTSNDKMTFKSLCEGVGLIRAKRFRIGITIEHANGKFTDHGLWVTVNPNIERDPELENEIRVPIEVELARSIFNDNAPERTSTNFLVPPANLERFQRRYPRLDREDGAN